MGPGANAFLCPELLPDPPDPPALEDEELVEDDVGFGAEELELPPAARAAPGNGFLCPALLLPDPPEPPELVDEDEETGGGSCTVELDELELMPRTPELLPEPEEDDELDEDELDDEFDVELDEELDGEPELDELELAGAPELDESDNKESRAIALRPLDCPSMYPTIAANTRATRPANT
jgi:hypothetical protein